MGNSYMASPDTLLTTNASQQLGDAQEIMFSLRLDLRFLRYHIFKRMHVDRWAVP